MSKLRKKLAIAGVCVALAAGTMTGCSSSNAGKAIATLDGEEIDFALVNVMVRYNQAQMQTMYGSLFGETMWDSYGPTTKSGIVENVEQMLILEKHMDEYEVTVSDEEKTQITEAAKGFMESNSEEVLKAMTADQATVERMLTLQLIQTKMRAAIIKDVDTVVSDEEAAQKTIQYVLFSTADKTGEDGTSVALTDEEKAEIKAQAEQVLEAVKGGEDMDTAAKAVDENKSSSTASYGKDNGSIADEVKEAADKLEDGQTADSVVEAEGGYYVVTMQSTFDAEATESQKTTIVTERQDAKFNEVYEGWKEGVEFTTDEKLLEKIDFIDTFEMKTTEAETEAAVDTEAVETSAETNGESAAESETDTAESTTDSETETIVETESETAAE